MANGIYTVTEVGGQDKGFTLERQHAHDDDYLFDADDPDSSDYEPCVFCDRSADQTLPVQPVAGQMEVIGDGVTLRHEDHRVPAKNRFSLPGGVDLVLNASTVVYYDHTSKRWRVQEPLTLGPQVNPAGQFGLEL